jgi:hypothetical protein
MKRARRDRGVTTVEWVIVAMIIGVGMIAVFRTFKDSYMAPATNRMGDCIEAAAGDGNLCGGLAVGGASNGGGGNAAGGNAAGGNAAGGVGGPVAQNGVGGNGAGAPAVGGGLSGNELANSVGDSHGGESHGGENGHYENPHAGIINGISYGFGLAQAAEDALIDAVKEANGIEVSGALDWAYRGARTAEGALIGVPLDLLANGMPHSFADGASFAVKNGVIAAIGFFGTPAAAAGAVALDKSLGYLADSVTGGTRYQDDWQDSIAWRMVHGQAGTIGREGVVAEQAREQQMIHEQLDYMRQQQQRDAEALREMMPH